MEHARADDLQCVRGCRGITNGSSNDLGGGAVRHIPGLVKQPIFLGQFNHAFGRSVPAPTVRGHTPREQKHLRHRAGREDPRHDISTTTGEEVVVFTLAESPCFRDAKKK
ncbi:MAG: hypothetical protein JW809_16595 [Pirellulales bacterium]|nr:hypothetical protein [Pirellulales bacterium]